MFNSTFNKHPIFCSGFLFAGKLLNSQLCLISQWGQDGYNPSALHLCSIYWKFTSQDIFNFIDGSQTTEQQSDAGTNYIDTTDGVLN